MTRLLVGAKELRGNLPNYAKLFDIVELRPVDTPLPTGNKLRRWREQVPPAFAFSIVLPKVVGQLVNSSEAKTALREALDAARVLEAASIVLITPPDVRPTQQNRERLATLRERLPSNGHMLAWEALGLWEPTDAIAQAHALGLLPVLDGVQTELAPGPLVYTRIHAMGNATSLGAARIGKLADQLRGRRSAFVIADGQVAKTLRAGLTTAMAALPGSNSVPSIFRPGPTPLSVSDEEQ